MSRIARYVIISAPGPAASTRVTTIITIMAMSIRTIMITTTDTIITPIRMPNTRLGRNRSATASPAAAETGSWTPI
jgi:hypothetical protein